MKKYNDALIEFMRWKSDEIDRICRESMGYFTAEDAADISGWTDAGVIWNKIVKGRDGIKGDATICPYCLKLMDLDYRCALCQYGQRHGGCGSVGNSTYGKIVHELDLLCARDEINIFLVIGKDKITDKIQELDLKIKKID